MANVLTVVFDIESEAYQAFSELKSFKQDNDTQIAQIALVKNEDGKITIKDSIDFDDASRDYATVGGIIGGLLGILSGPIGVIIGYGIGSLAGAASGSMTDASDNSLIEEVTTKLLDGEVAVIALVHEEDESILNHVFAPYKTILCVGMPLLSHVKLNLQDKSKMNCTISPRRFERTSSKSSQRTRK